MRIQQWTQHNGFTLTGGALSVRRSMNNLWVITATLDLSLFNPRPSPAGPSQEQTPSNDRRWHLECLVLSFTPTPFISGEAVPILVKKYKHTSAFHIFFAALGFLGDFWGGGRDIYFFRWVPACLLGAMNMLWSGISTDGVYICCPPPQISTDYLSSPIVKCANLQPYFDE